MCDIHLDASELWDERDVKARKSHRCNMCRGLINAGDTYVRHFSIYDHDVTSNKMCKPCEAICKDFAKSHEMYSTPEYMPRLLNECVSGLLYHPETAQWQLAILEMQSRALAATSVTP
jgi:hypothetical protein